MDSLDYSFYSPYGMLTEESTSLQEQLARMYSGGYESDTTSLTSGGSTADYSLQDQLAASLEGNTSPTTTLSTYTAPTSTTTLSGSTSGGSIMEQLESGTIELTQENIDDWLQQVINMFIDYSAGPEFEQDQDRAYLPEEALKMKELLERVEAGESVDLSEIQAEYPELYSYIDNNYNLSYEGTNTESSELLPAPSTKEGITGLLSDLGYSNEEIQEILNSEVKNNSGEFEGNPVLENILVQNGYDGSSYSVKPISTGGSLVTGEGESSIEEDIAGLPTFEQAVEKVKEAFPTWEDLWGSIKDKLPSDPKEWGGAIRSVIEAAGINLPSGDVMDILNGGYGIIFDPATSILTAPGTGSVFVPGIPGGISSNSTILGPLEDLISDPVGTLSDKVSQIWGEVISDPQGFIEGILAGTTELPAEIWGVLTGAVDVTKDIYDWVVDNYGEKEETIEESVATNDSKEEEEEVDINTDDTTEDKPEDLAAQLAALDLSGLELEQAGDFTFGGVPGPAPEDSESSETSPFTFGGDSGDPNATTTISQEEIDRLAEYFNSLETTESLTSNSTDELVNNVTDTAEVIEEVLTSSGGGGGSSGGRAAGMFDPFMSGINYTTPQMANLISIPKLEQIRILKLFEDYLA